MDLTDRNIRQHDIVPPKKLETISVMIVGVGAVGRQLTLQLTTMGVSDVTIVDPQRVDVENLGAQGFREKDLGRWKVEAVAEVMLEINSGITIHKFAEHFKAAHVPRVEAGRQRAIFVCVDNMDARAKIWRCAKLSYLYIDSRMSAEVARVITLFSDDEMYQETCTAKTTIYCANIQAGLLASQFTKRLRGMKLSMDMTLNILAGDLDHDLIQDTKTAAV